MENRQTPTNPPKNYNKDRNDYRSQGDKPFGERKYPPRDNNFQPRNDRYPSRDDRSQGRDDRPPNPNNRPYQRDDRPPNPNNRPYQRDSRSTGRDDRAPRRDDGFQPRNNGGGGRFQPRGDNRFQGKPRFGQKGRPPKPWEQEDRPRIVSEMQITDGKHRGKYLKTTDVEGMQPTARRIREVMFRILYRRVRAHRFLDLCAGCGTIGLEAISRGALLGTFVERSAKMCVIIKKNMETCGIKEGHGEVIQAEAVPFLKKMGKRRRQWDVIYFDPPNDSNYDEVLAYLSRGVALRPKGTLVIEHHSEMFFPETIGLLKRWRVLEQGDTTISFYERQETANQPKQAKAAIADDEAAAESTGE